MTAFFYDLMRTYWRGELLWHRAVLVYANLDLAYSVSSATLVFFGAVAVCQRKGGDAGRTCDPTCCAQS